MMLATDRHKPILWNSVNRKYCTKKESSKNEHVHKTLWPRAVLKNFIISLSFIGLHVKVGAHTEEAQTSSKVWGPIN